MRADRLALQRGEGSTSFPQPIQQTGGDYDLDIDVRTSTVIVRVETAAPSHQQAFEDTYSSAVVVKSGLAQPRACTQADCRNAMLGGLHWQLGTSGKSCTTGFSAVANTIRYTISAGHCYVNTGIAARRHAGDSYGSVDLYGYSGPLDAERVKRTNYQFRNSGKFVVQDEYPRMVTGYQSHSNIVIGTLVGKTGITTGTTRGYVLSKTVAPGYVPNSYNFVSADMCSDGGDSGGSMFRNGVAWGVLSGGWTDTSCRGWTGGLKEGPTIFGAMNYVLNSLNVNLLTNYNLGPGAHYSYSCFALTCAFDASESKDHDGAITRYPWNFGDGTNGSGMAGSKTYSLPGTYTVTLTVRDNDGATHSTSKSVRVIV